MTFAPLAILLACLLRAYRATGAGLALWTVLATTLLSPLECRAQTNISGQVSVDLHLTAASSPYLLTGTVTVTGGATITAEPGVTVYMANAAQLVIEQGTVILEGSEAAPIRVLSDKLRLGQAGAPGDWGQWQFGPGTTGHRLSHLVFQHGRGLSFRGTSATLNHVGIHDQLGAAVQADLATSLVGVGNQANGNTVNGVLLPPGDILGTVRWGLRGLPYVVSSGVTSVGLSPRIASVAPSVLQSGDVVSLTVSGSGLAGIVSATTSNPDLVLQVEPGGTETQLVLSASVSSLAQAGKATLWLLGDAGEVEATDALLVTLPEPRLSAVVPTEVFTDRGPTTLTISGQNLRATTVAELDGVALATTVISPTSATATLPVQASAAPKTLRLRTPDATAPGGSLLTSPLDFVVKQPSVALSPAPVSMFEGNTQVMRLTLPFAAPSGGVQFSVGSSAPLIVTAQSTVTVPEGATFVEFDLRGAGIGQSVIAVSRIGWTTAQLTATVIDPPRRVDLTPIISAPLGIFVGPDNPAAFPDGPHLAAPLGVVVGVGATGLAPAAGVVGTQMPLTVRGSGLEVVTQVTAVPSTGLSFSSPAGSGDGRQFSVQVTIAPDAPKTTRRIVLSSASGEVKFADATVSQFLVTTPPPEVVSVSPQVVQAGGASTLLSLRGQNFRDVVAVRLEPTAGMSVVGTPVATSDGTLLTISVQAAADAPSGPRKLVVVAAGGESSPVASAANTIQVARLLGTAFESITSPAVGIQSGTSLSFDDTAGPYAAPALGVMVGLAAKTLSPNVGLQGGQAVVTVQGVGLSAVTAAVLEPATGLVVGAPSPSADGRQLTFTIDVDLNAPTTLRRIVLNTASGVPVPFADPTQPRIAILPVVGQRFEAQLSPVVGLQVGTPTSAIQDDGPYIALPIGISVGSGATSMSPRAAIVGSSLTLSIRGVGLGAVTSVSALPGEGLTFGTPVASSDGGQLNVPLSVAPNAAMTLRRINLGTATGTMAFADLAVSQFLVTAPVPNIDSIGPQVVVAGQPSVTLTLRGRNFRDISSVRFEPADGLVAVGIPVADSSGTSLTIAVQASSAAVSGPRTLILVAAGGESSNVATPGNTVQVARSVGTQYEGVASPLVGLDIGNIATFTEATTAVAPSPGVIVGTGVSAMTPVGSVKGVAGGWQFQGSGLNAVTAVRLVAADGSVNSPSNGVTLGVPVVGNGGTALSVPYAVDPSAPNRRYRVELLAGTDAVAVALPSATQWQVVDQPRIDSITPPTLQQGRSYSLQVRGRFLGSAIELVFETAAGIQVASGIPVHSTDALGELLTVPLLVAPDSPTGPQVVRLRFPAGLTSAVPTPANVVNVEP